MNNVKIFRARSTEQGTSGHIIYAGRTSGVLELPDRQNAPGLSCIPAGYYEVVWTRSRRLKRYTYEILRVAGRGGIRIHSGNFAGDITKGYQSHSLGCPLLCSAFGALSGQLAGLGSRTAVSQLELAFNRQPFELRIQWI